MISLAEEKLSRSSQRFCGGIVSYTKIIVIYIYIYYKISVILCNICKIWLLAHDGRIFLDALTWLLSSSWPNVAEAQLSTWCRSVSNSLDLARSSSQPGRSLRAFKGHQEMVVLGQMRLLVIWCMYTVYIYIWLSCWISLWNSRTLPQRRAFLRAGGKKYMIMLKDLLSGTTQFLRSKAG